MDFTEQLDLYLRARFTLIVLVTAEEERALDTIRAVCERTGAWSVHRRVSHVYESDGGGRLLWTGDGDGAFTRCEGKTYCQIHSRLALGYLPSPLRSGVLARRARA